MFTEHKVRGHERVGQESLTDTMSSVTFCMDAVYSDLSLEHHSESESTRATLDYTDYKKDLLTIVN